MKTLTLDLATLAVDSFDAGAADAVHGVVEAFMEGADTKQVKCTYFCSYACNTAMPC